MVAGTGKRNTGARGVAWAVLAAGTLAGVPGACAAQAAVTPSTAPPLPPPRPASREPEAPLPPARPPDLLGALRTIFGPPMPPRPAPAPSTPNPPQPPGAVPIEEELACVRLFNAGQVEARAVTTVPPAGTGCGIAAPVEVSAVITADKRHIPLQPPVTINCAMADAMASWVRDDLVPAFAATSNTLVGLASTSGYACRGRNNVAGAKVSEHGRGNAVDIGGFRTAGGEVIGVKQQGTAILPAVKATACARFATVLGPGSDGFHETHMHLDLAPRRHGSRICHWDMP